MLTEVVITGISPQVRTIPSESDLDGIGIIFFFVSFMIIVSLVLMQVVIAGNGFGAEG